MKHNPQDKKVKIAMLGHKSIPSRQGGIEIVVEELAVRMAALGHQVTIYNRSGHHVSGKEFDQKKLREYKGIRMKYVPTIDKKGLAAMSASFFAAVAAAFGKYDVVHFHAEGPCAMLWFLDVLEKGFKEFFEKEVPGNPQKAEYLIPIFIGELLEQGKMSVKVLGTNDTWYGMTYHEDVAAVKGSFKEMLENGVYKADLFSDL